jgi:HEAT repeat protein
LSVIGEQEMEVKQGIALTLLALVFTVGLTFASIELPGLLDAFLEKNVNTLDVATGLNELSAWKTELYLQHYHLRLIGYVSLGLIIIFIVVGFITEKSGWTSAGAILLFLPAFGHFAATMFFLGGLGFLRLLWLPVLDVSFNLFRLGDIITLPYELLVWLFSLVGLNRWLNPSYLVTGLGLLILFLGTLTWFTARIQKKGVADFWIYRLSRHPQYVGWIIWSYGVMFLPGANIRLCYGLSNSLPWLLSTMIIIGVAMVEEMKMKRIHGETYELFRRRAPFLVPLPRFIVSLLTFPSRLMFRKDHPGRKREIVAVLSIYTVLCLGVSALYGGLISVPDTQRGPSGQQIEDLVKVLRRSENRGEKRLAAGLLERIGTPAVDSLLALVSDSDPTVRAYSAGALGGIPSEQVVSPLITLLHDRDAYVRRTAAGALGRTGSARAVPPLIDAMRDRTREMDIASARALAQIRHPDVIPLFIKALTDTTTRISGVAAEALGEMGVKEAVEPLVRCFEETPNCPYDAVGGALMKLNSDRAADAWISGLKKGSWWYPRVSCANALGKHKFEKALEPLHEALGDTSREVRRAVVLALMEIGSPKSLEVLRGAQKDNDFEVRIYAGEALRRIAPPQ